MRAGTSDRLLSDEAALSLVTRRSDSRPRRPGGGRRAARPRPLPAGLADGGAATPMTSTAPPPPHRLAGAARSLLDPDGRATLVDRAVRSARTVRDRVAPRGAGQRLDDVTRLANLVTAEAAGVAVDLGLFDLLADGPRDADALAAATGTDPDALERLCRHLARRGFLAERPATVFALADLGQLLRRDHPSGRAVQFGASAARTRMAQALSRLDLAVRTGRPVYETVHGSSLWEQVARDPAVAEGFDAEMTAHARRLGPHLATRLDWSSATRVIDVGGGTGELLRQLLLHHDHLQGTLVELSRAAARARAHLAASEVAGRCEVVESDAFSELPAGADACVLSWILHDWDDDHAVAILERCHAALAPGGRVVVVEQPLDLAGNTDLDLRLLVYFGGRERTRHEYGVLAAEAGLRVLRWTPLTGGFAAAELVG